MSNYSKITDFAAKDSLSTGNPAKIVKGVEIDDELVAISGAVATKADTISPTFTGTTTVGDLVVGGTANITGAVDLSGAITVDGASSLQAVTATSIVADTLTLDSSIVFEGATEDAYETTITVTDPTADRTITIPNKSGTVALTSDLATTSITTASGTYSAAGSSTVTVSVSSHGLSAGDLVYLDFTSGTAVDGEFTVASVINTDSYTVTYGSSITTSGNITQYYSVLGQIRLASPTEVLEGSNANKAITPYTYQTTKLGTSTAVTLSSGTYTDFTSIPSWVKRITVMLSDVSTSGTSLMQVQIGTSGGVSDSGYTSLAAYDRGAEADSTTGLLLTQNQAESKLYSGHLVLTKLTGYTWVASTIIVDPIRAHFGAGTKTLSTTLDRVRLTTVNGTDTFDAGKVNILYE